MFYATISNMSELGMVWMGDMVVQNEPPQELMMDPNQSDPSYFTQGHQTFEDIRNQQIPPTAMVRYLPPQFTNECSETEEPIEGVDVQDIQQEYEQPDSQEINEYLGLDDYITEEDNEQIVNNAATQTQDVRNRKIKPIKHPGLVLKTPIAYQPHTDLDFIPIRKDGIAVCEKCGAIGVKHAFYTKERRFCSRACARSSENIIPRVDSTSSPTPSIDQISMNSNLLNDVKPILPQVPIKEEIDSFKDYKMDEPMNTVPPIQSIITEELPVRRKRTAEIAGSYDWTPQLKSSGFCAAPIGCFKHAPLSHMSEHIVTGMKVEVENTDCDEICEAYPDSFWVATIIHVYGYKALLRYEGFHSSEKDFWVSTCSNDIHPVGWCASIGKPLIPPNTIRTKYREWKTFLINQLTGARTLPMNFGKKVNDSMKSRFRCGLQLEVVDKNRISQVKVAIIEKIVGKRLNVRYYDAPPDDIGFWCHQDSPLIHPVGWARHVGQILDAYPEYHQRVLSGKLSPDDATEELFMRPKNNNAFYGYSFCEGMKIEAIDPLNLSAICAATIMRVLKEGYLMIKIDSYDEDASGADWFCYHSYSPCIFPVGFCAQHGLSLTPPKGYDPTIFTWDSYLEETNTIPAPQEFFNRELPPHGFIEGMRLEAADLMDPRLVCVATITRVVGRLLRVHFDGWEDEYDQWLDCQSPDIYPVGWCDLVDHKLEGPRSYATLKTSPLVKSPKGLKRKSKRKIKKEKGAKTFNSRNLLTRAQQHMQQQQQFAEQRQYYENQQMQFECFENQLGPAQGIKVEHDFESIPEQSTAREPEPAQEPAGPDQTLPSPTSGQGLSSEPPPRERTATSYINVTAANGKYIPRLADGTQRNSELGELAPTEWNVFDVAQFLRVNDWAAYCDNFSKRKVDGRTLLSLSHEQIMDLTGNKVGPSLKISDLIQQLKFKVNFGNERMKLKKML